ncbi:lipopolysaccharide biosynthesis glycosyltransferase [Melghiribacillus thermohalophilus]|uniref:Lipopolysaccharide biosynthesis glycosyltransferase n=2 Tax=Melghiribacillus thermohalophilus TaxID=1324956 RepID=A0A4R3MVC9_9BACI|nr:lipopolysaccharide biosynthesis glycosyltransferase [Melghiribacillus thermohalophilus]
MWYHMYNILVTLDANYIPPLNVLLHSLFKNHPDDSFSIYLMHSSIPDRDLTDLHQFVNESENFLFPIKVDPQTFSGAPVFRHYTAEMYYRLLAHQLLPDHLERILYLDPDIVCMNSISKFYNTPFHDHLFIAAEHEYSSRMARLINKMRLRTPKAKGYYNTGVLLMNLEGMRETVYPGEIFQFIEQNKLKLVLPDQDILNGLYWDRIQSVPSMYYNFDARYYEFSKFLPNQKYTLEWIREHTVFIHYCGKNKPWHDHYRGTLGMFYKEYEKDLMKLRIQV